MRLRVLAALLAAVFILAAAIEAFNAYSAYRDLRAGTDEARAAARLLGSDPGGWTEDRINHASAEAADAQLLIDRGRHRLDTDPLLATAGVVPVAGDQVVGVRDLADAAAEATAATRDAVQVAEVYRNVSAGQGSPQRFLDAMNRARPLLEDASRRLHAVLDRIDQDRARPLAQPLSTQLADAAVVLADATAQADSALQLARLAPAALGSGSPRTYLVLLPNPTEIRPDGGFSGVVGTMTFQDGAPSSIKLVDQYSLNGRYRQKFPIPLPIQQHLVEANNSLELGDAGWDADLPSSAPLYEQLWQSATGEPVDGTLIIDPYAIEALLQVTGPVTVAPYGAFDSTNFLTRLNVLINADGTQRGTAVPAVAAAVLKAILGQPGANYTRMLSNLVEQARQRHVQIVVHDKAVQAAVQQAGFDGAIRDAQTADYAMVVDANLGGNKADAYVKKSEEIRVEKPASGLANHELKLTYAFSQLVTETDHKLVASTHNNPGGHYRNYLRVYVPQEANMTGFQLLVDGKQGATSAITENTTAHGKRVIGAYLDIAPGQTAVISMTYITPLDPAAGYRLLVQKQAGRPDFPTSLWVSYPGGENRQQSQLTQDTTFEVKW